MARKRDPRREEAFQIWIDSNGSIMLKDIADKLKVADTQIRKWKSLDKWDELKGNVTNSKRNVTNEQAKSRGAPKGNKNATGNSGNPNPSSRFPKHNSIQKKHGLFSKFLHEEQIEIMDAMTDMNFADQLWMQIEIKFSAIIRMQKLMWVDTDDDHLKVESGYSSSDMGDSTTYKVAFAYERFESYIRAQTRAMAEYRNLVKQYIEMTDEYDERRLKLQQMQLGIEKTAADTEFIKERTKLIKGSAKDTSLLEALIAARKGSVLE